MVIGPQATPRGRSGPARSGPAPSSPGARAQSSMMLWRMASMPPAASSAVRRASMQPPAAAAIWLCGIVHRAEGKQHVEEEDEGRDQEMLGRGAAVTAAPSATPAPCSPSSARATSRRQIVGAVGDIGVGEPEKFRRECRGLLARPGSSPRACRSSRADAARRSAPSGVSEFSARARSPVPSSDWSSTSTTWKSPG